MRSFRISSRLLAPPERVWAHATSAAGVNAELAPLLRMTSPPGFSALGDAAVPLGKPLCRSVILLFGVLPIDYDDITLEALDPGKSFRERSPMLSMRTWIHERTIDPRGGGAKVTDRVAFEPRLPGVGALLAPLLHLVFENRHRQLVRIFGGEGDGLRVVPA
jgi:ligand-binding SRPBCC domain-containing protein